MSTTAFAAKRALVDKLAAVTEFADLQAAGAIWYGYQGAAGQRPRECVWVGEITWTGEVGASLGNFRRDENYQIMLTVESHTPGDTQAEANERVHARLSIIEELLRDPRFLAVPGIYECGIIPQLLGEGTDPAGRGALFIVAVSIRARI